MTGLETIPADNHLNPIWGSPLTKEFPPSITTGSTHPTVPIVRQLHTFLRDQIELWSPDLIIVVERKGTAILRALKEWKEDPIDWPWDKVLSSSTVDQVPDDFFLGKRILVFDDMMRTGNHLTKLVNSLKG